MLPLLKNFQALEKLALENSTGGKSDVDFFLKIVIIDPFFSGKSRVSIFSVHFKTCKKNGSALLDNRY